ncbi:MAG: rhomboid family intramembrane serine protease [Spirochaetales bacterium]|nr:rhomboid family intramembrane serine protease [Spirochaetales bacterium]
MNNLNFRRPFSYAYRNVSLWLIGINILVFIIIYATRSGSLFVNLSLSAPGLKSGRIWQLATYMFVHGSFQHLLFNMLGLFFFGTQVERTMGSAEFLVFYLATGILSGLASFVFYLLAGTNTLLLGASGAIFAVLFAFAMYYPNARVFVFMLFPIRAIYLVLVYAAIEMFSQIFGSGTGIAHLTHLAGFVFAWLYFLFRLRINPLEVFRGHRNRPYH